MKRFFFFTTMMSLILAGVAEAQDPRGYRGRWNGWAYAAATLDLGVWRVTMQAEPGDHHFKIATEVWNVGEWTHDGLIPLGEVVDAYVRPGEHNSWVNATVGRHYTFAMNNVPYGTAGLMIVQETSNTPVSIESVSHVINEETVIISIATSATPSTGENIYVRYTLDNWASSAFVQATGSGTAWTATIVHDSQDAGQTSSYYVLTTTVATPTHLHADLQTIRWDNNNGNNYSYTVESSASTEAPTSQATAIQFSDVGSHSLTVSWTSGNGANRLLVAREGGAVSSHPVDGTSYSADSRFGDGSMLGTGNYVVYSGAGSSVSVSGLNPETTYHFRVYEFNGGGASTKYNSATAAGNPASVMTAEGIPYELYINEVMASNDSTLQDEDGDWPDWVELYNAGPAAVDLQGWGLSDNYDNPFKWVFGDVSIGAGEFLIVWASGKDRPDGNHLHTSWAISAAGEEVILTHPDGTRIDELEPVAIPTDVSLGRQPDGTGDWLFFTTPTPGAANTTVGTPGFLGLPQFSVEGGLYSASQTLEITTVVAGAQIRFTTDGSEPTASSPLYSGPIALNSRAGTPNTISEIPTNHLDPYGEFREGWQAPAGEVFKIHTIRARLFKDGYLPSPAVTHSYLIDSAGMNRYSLPIISIATDSSGLFGHNGIYVPDNFWNSGGAWERPGTMEFFETDGTTAIRQDIGIRIHGGMTRNRPRKSLRIYARGPRTFRHQLFPDKDLDRFETFILRNGGNDWGDFVFRDLFMQSLAANTDLDRQYGRPVIVFINGEYWGIHNIRERFDDGYIEHNYGLESHEFVQFESAWDNMPGHLEGLPQYDRGNADYASAYMDLHTFIRDNGVQSSTNYEFVQDRMDIDNFIDFYQAHIFFGNTDWPGNNIRIWRSVETNRTVGAPYRHDGRLRFMLFDTDFGFGADFGYVPGRDEFAAHNTLAFAASPVETDFSNKEHHTVMFRRLLENEDFRERFIMRFSDQLNTAYSRTAVTNKLEELVAVVGPEMTEHVHRWRQPWDWGNELDRVRSYAQQRTAAVRGHLQSHFNLGPRHDLTLDVSDSDQGFVRVREFDLAEGTDGFAGYPWTGSYFSDFPVTLTAVAQPGYRFVEWVATEDAHTVLASDARANYSEWTTGSNQGTGFSSWTLTSGGGSSGHFLDDTGWGLWANNGEEANAVRPFSSALAVGQTFSVRMQNGWIDGGRSVGVALQNSSGEPLWEMYFIGDEQSYRINNDPSGIPWTSGALDIEVSLTGATTWTARIEPGGHEFSGGLLSQGNQTIDRFRAWNYSAGGGSEYDFFINNLQIFTTAAGTPETYSTDESIDVMLSGASAFQAVFEEIVSEESSLVHYWNFNDTGNLLIPTYSLVAGAGIGVDTGTVAEVTSGTGQDFVGENARFGDDAGAHLRLNNPTSAVMSIALPTTGFEDIVVMYETRRSGSGAGTQNIKYTLNGSTYTPFTTLTITETPTLHMFDFTDISGANNNSDFGIRVSFEVGDGGTVGNNRFDNMTLEGVSLGELNLPPEVDQPIEFQELIQGAPAVSFNLSNVFSDPDGDPMTFGATSSDTDLVTVNVAGANLTVTPVQRGEALVTVTANDGNNPEVSTSFRVLVYPNAYVLQNGNFTFGEWDPDTPEKTYPEHMLFLQSDRDDTVIDTPLLFAYHLEATDYHADDIAAGTVGFPYNNTGRTRINGLGDDGVAFINTGQGRDLGGALLALDTRNVTDAPVGWLAGTVLANNRIYAIRLQYRVGSTGPWIDVLDASEQPVEYVRASDGHTQPMGPVNLPAVAMGQEYLQVLWRYYWTDPEGVTGSRAQLRLDDILVANSKVLPASQLVYSVEPVAFYQSGHVLPPFTVQALDPNGLLDTQFTGTISLSRIGDGALSGTTSVAAEAGVATFTNVVVTGIGTNRLQAASGSLASALSAVLSFADINGVLVPQFMQGEQGVEGDNNDRIPYAFRAQIDGLLPDATYRYGNRVVTSDDPWDQDGAGNMIFVTGDATDWIRNTSSPRFEAADFADRHFEFTTDSNGSYTGWFVTEPSGNARFTPGNTLQLRILLNDGQGGNAEQHYLTLPEEVTVIRFGAQAHEATGIMGASTQAARNFVFLYDETAGTSRPLAGVPIEITGSVVDDRYAAFYQLVVAETAEFWGTLIPNSLANGVRRIEYRAWSNAAILAADTSASGIDGTVNPSGGLNPILLDADVGIPVFLPGGNGRWDLHASWSTGFYPDAVDAAAIINEPFDADRDVDIESPIRIGHLIVNNAASTNMNRIRARGENTLTFESSTGPAQLTIDGSGSGFVEFRTQSSIVLASDLLITITNVNENHGLEGVLDDDYGALRLRDDWIGPGGLIKQGAGVMTMTGSGKDYTGATIVEFGVLRITEPATPQNTAGVTVNLGGQLRLVSDGDRVYPFGGTLTLSGMGRGGDVPGGGELGVLGALRYDPGSNDNRAEVTNSVVIADATSLHVDGTRNELALSGPISGSGLISKSGGGMLVLSGDSSGYTTVPMIVSNGTLQVDGVLGAAVSLTGDGVVTGSGSVGALSGAGTVAPGPGTETLTAPSVNGLNYRFTFTETDATILRLTGGSPFVGDLNAANTIEVFFDVETLDSSSVFEGGFFTDEAADFIAAIENANWTFYVRDAAGSVEHEGETYSLYSGALSVGTVSATPDFGAGPVSGRILQIGEAEAPAGFAGWQNEEFSEAELADPEISGPLADADNTGIPNLLRYALGLGRADAFEDALPQGDSVPAGGVLRHRRLLDENAGIAYVLWVCDDLLSGSWEEVVLGTDLVEIGREPTGDGITEVVEYSVPEGTFKGSPRYFRLQVKLDD